MIFGSIYIYKTVVGHGRDVNIAFSCNKMKFLSLTSSPLLRMKRIIFRPPVILSANAVPFFLGEECPYLCSN